ncbi:MAG: trypsin-like peptidase domain-containing protein, partial [Chthoniobacteraceae bacterium]
GLLRLDPKELLGLLREVLEKQGVPADELKSAELPELLRLMREKNPDTFKGLGLGFGGMQGFDKATEKKLADHFAELLEGHRPGTLGAAPATFPLRNAKKPADPLAFATGVRGDGWLLTKASEVGSGAELQCEIKGEWVAAKVVRTWPEHDLALVKVAAKGIPVVKFSERGALPVGTFISAVAPEGREPVAIGIVSVPVRNEQTKGRGFLGVQIESDERGLKINKLVPGGPAKASGLQEQDRILEFDGKKPDSVYMFTKMVSDRKAGDKVKLKFQRGNAIAEKEIALADRGAMVGSGRAGNDRMNSMGSTISKRRTDFSSVMQTDLPLQATQCGGPVTDLDGDVVGIVIARSGRVETMVLPSETIRQLLARVDFSKEGQPAAQKAEAAKPAAQPAPQK